MQIGAMNHPANNPITEIQWIGENGLDFVDFTFEPPSADPDEVDCEAIKSALAKYNLHVVGHTAWYIPIGSPFSGIRQSALHEFRRSLNATHQIGATVMNLHYGKNPPFFTSPQIVDWHAEVLQPLCEEAAGHGVTIVLEHLPHGGHNQLENIVAIMERVPLLRFHLDSGHAKLERGYDRWDEYIDQLGDKLLHVHLSENDGTADQHLPLGAAPRSNTNWPQHIKKLKSSGYDGTITLEVFAPQKEYLLLNRDLLRKWWDRV